MTNPFDIPSNHRLLAAESALTFLYGEAGLMGVTAKIRDEAVNRYLVSQGIRFALGQNLTLSKALRTLIEDRKRQAAL